MVFENIVVIVLAIAGALVVGYLIGHAIGAFRRERTWRAALPEHRADAIARSRAVLTGQFSEQIAPYLPGFLYSPTECKFIGKPIDFVVFNGLDEKNVREIVFVEVKSGNSRLSGTESSVKDAVLNGRVKWAEYRAPD